MCTAHEREGEPSAETRGVSVCERDEHVRALASARVCLSACASPCSAGCLPPERCAVSTVCRARLRRAPLAAMDHPTTESFVFVKTDVDAECDDDDDAEMSRSPSASRSPPLSAREREPAPIALFAISGAGAGGGKRGVGRLVDSTQADDRRMIHLVRDRPLLYARSNLPVASYQAQVKKLWREVADIMAWTGTYLTASSLIIYTDLPIY